MLQGICLFCSFDCSIFNCFFLFLSSFCLLLNWVSCAASFVAAVDANAERRQTPSFHLLSMQKLTASITSSRAEQSWAAQPSSAQRSAAQRLLLFSLRFCLLPCPAAAYGAHCDLVRGRPAIVCLLFVWEKNTSVTLSRALSLYDAFVLVALLWCFQCLFECVCVCARTHKLLSCDVAAVVAVYLHFNVCPFAKRLPVAAALLSLSIRWLWRRRCQRRWINSSKLEAFAVAAVFFCFYFRC